MSMALWCVLIAGVLPIVVVGFAKVHRGYDNRLPRAWAAGADPRAQRAYAAHLNAYEAFPLFAVAVLVAETKAGPSGLTDALAAVFVFARLTHAGAYIVDRANLRSIAWAAGWFLTLAIFTTPAWR